MYYQKHPNPQTLLAVSNVFLPGYELLAEDEARDWAAQQIALGWEATPSPGPTPDAVTMTRLSFLGRLTDAELLGILTSEDAGVILFRTLFLAANEIRSDDPRTIDGLAYLEAAGLLAAGRAAELLTP